MNRKINSKRYWILVCFLIALIVLLLFLANRNGRFNKIDLSGAEPLVNYDSSNTFTDGVGDAMMNLEGYVDNDESTLLVAISYRVFDGFPDDDYVDSVNNNGDPLNFICKAEDSGYVTELWVQNFVNSGDYYINAFWTEDVDDRVIGVAVFSNTFVDDPIRDSSCTSGWDTFPSATVSASPDDIVFGATATYTGDFNDVFEGAGVNRVWQESATNVKATAGTMDGNSGNTTIEWEMSVSWPWSVAAVSLKPAEGGEGDFEGPDLFIFEVQEYTSDVFIISGNASDDSGVDAITYSVDGGGENNITVITGSLGDQYIEFDEFVGPLDEGTRNILVKAEDAFGNTTTEEFDVLFDFSHPSVNMTTQPSTEVTNAANNAFEGTINDAIPILNAYYVLDGGAPVDLSNFGGTATAWNIAFDTNGLANGEHTVEIYTSDALNNFGLAYTITFEVFVPNTWPTCVLLNHPTPTVDTTPTYTGTCSDNTGVTKIHHRIYHEVNGDVVAWPDSGDPATVTLTSGNWGNTTVGFTFTAPALAEGVHFVQIIGFNGGGGFSPESDRPIDRVVIEAVDNAPPVIFLNEILPDPITDLTPYITGTCGDTHPFEVNSTIASIDYRIDGGAWNPVPAQDGTFNSNVEIYSLELPPLEVHTMYTVEVRCIDAAGNSTSNAGTNAQDTFTTIPVQNGEPEEISFTENFTTQLRNAVNFTNAIWGNGIVRLKESLSFTKTAIDTTNYAGKYATISGESSYGVYKGTGPLIWYIKENQFISYNTQTQLSTTYNAGDYGMTRLYYLAQTVHPGDGDILVWLGGDSGLLLFNVTENNHVLYNANGFNSANFNPNIIIPDSRSGRVGAYIRTSVANGGGTSNIAYLNTNGTFNNTGDDTFTWIETGGGIPLDDVVSVYLDGDNNYVYLGAYADGLVKLGDNNTPNNTGDDQRIMYGDYDGVFGIEMDPDSNTIFFINNFGADDSLHVITDDNGTPFTAGDDTIVELADNNRLFAKGVLGLKFIKAREYIGNQLVILTDDASVIYYNTNNSYADTLDDTIIVLELSEGVYPLSLTGLVVGDFNSSSYSSWYVTFDRQGLYRINVERGWNNTNTAIAFSPPPSNKTVVNNIELSSLDVIDKIDSNGVSDPNSNASVDTFISIDDGITWENISIGERKTLGDSDYRVRFRMDLAENPGTTPVIDSYSMSYVTYVNQAQTEATGFAVIPSLTNMNVGTAFNLTIRAHDSLGYLSPNYNNNVTIQLLDAQTLAPVTGLSVNAGTLTNGQVTLTGVRINSAGNFLIRVTDGNIQSNSTNIGVVAQNAPVVPDEEKIPFITFVADRYSINQGETITFTWQSENVTSVFIFPGIGLVSLNGSINVTPQQSTEYRMYGYGPYGDVEVKFNVNVIQPTVTPVDPPAQPTQPSQQPGTPGGTSGVQINVNDEDVITYPGETIVIEWNIEGDVDSVYIDYLDEFVDKQGSFEIIAEEDLEINIIVEKDGVKTIKTIVIEVDSDPVEFIVPFDEIRVEEGEEVEITWDIQGNPQTVYIDYLDRNVGSKGSFKFRPTEDTEINIIARKGNREFVKTITVNVGDEPLVESVDLNISEEATIAPLIIAASTLALAVGSTVIYVSSATGMNPYKVGSLLLSVFLNKKRKYWGIIYDPKTNRGIPLAVIRLLDKNGAMVNQTISNFDGIYGFISEGSGSFTLEIKAEGYVPVTKTLMVGRSEDIIEDIALMSRGSIGSNLKYYWTTLTKKSNTIVLNVLKVMVIVGFTLSILALAENASTFNILIFILYLLIFSINFYLYFKTKNSRIEGRVVDTQSRKNVQGAIVRVYEEANKVKMAITNQLGMVKIVVNPGKHKTIVSKNGYKRKDFDSLKFDERGYIGETIKIDKEEAVQGGEETISNPFN